MLDFDFANRCVGCAGCYSICAAKAIEMGVSKDGFYQPVLNADKCINCGMCDKVCPAVSQPAQKRDVYTLKCVYAFTKNADVRATSTSGGIFSELANQTLRQGGMVCGCVWDDNFHAKHILTDDPDSIVRMRGSKYVQSDLGDCFQQIKACLKTRVVLFAGTPCQTTALRAYVGDNPSLFTCALICGGVPSPKVWFKYKAALERKMKSKIVSLQMRSKITNWLVPEIRVQFGNGKVIKEVLLTSNLYGTTFNTGLTISNACMHCTYKLDTVQADVIIGDHWGLDKRMLSLSGNKGATVIVSLTEKGESAVHDIGAHMHLFEGDIQTTIDSHFVLMRQHKPNVLRESFFSQLDRKDILDNLGENMPVQRMQLLKSIINKLGLYIPLYTLKWKITKHN